MWQVLRAKQGEFYQPSPPTRGSFEENSNHIARFECRPEQKPANPHSLTQPYGAGLYIKLLTHLSSHDLILRQKAVAALVLCFGQREEHIVSAVQQGGIVELIKALHDFDEGVRVQACLALTYIVGHPSGQREILNKGLINKLMEPVLNDTPPVAAQGLRLLAAMDAHHDVCACTEILVREGCIPIYIQKMKTGPTNEVRAEALKALSKVYHVKEAYIQVLDTDVFDILTSLLSSNIQVLVAEKGSSPDSDFKFSLEILEWVAENISKLCFYAAGKRAACRCPETTTELLRLLECEDTSVRIAVSGALMGITIENKGKELCLHNNGCEKLLSRLTSESSHFALTNVIKCICNVSENPDARTRFLSQKAVSLLIGVERRANNNQSLINAITRTIDSINWKP